MNPQRQFKQKTLMPKMTIAYAMVATTITTFIIIRSMKLNTGDTSLLIDGAAAMVFGASVIGAFMMVFHAGITQGKGGLLSDPRHLLPISCLSQGLAYTLYFKQLMPDFVFFCVVIGLQSFTTWLACRLAMRGFRLNDSSVRLITRVFPILMLTFGFVSWPLKNFFSTENILIGAAIFQGLLTSFGLLVIAVWFSAHPKHRLDTASIIQSYKYRSDWTSDKLSIFNMTLLTGIAHLVGVLLSWNEFRKTGGSYPEQALVSYHLLFIPAVLDAWRELSNLGDDRIKLQELSKLTLKSARKVLSRHKQPNDTWSATVGTKTATLTIESDLENTLANKLPATLQRIREDEIINFIGQLVKDQSLSIQQLAERIVCTIDPEHSIRPCLDALRLCSALYLDAAAILERRILGLTSLLPIVNPGLGQAVKRQASLALLKKTKWFFYFDYTWTDQSIVNTPNGTRYGIQLDQMIPEVRMRLIETMRQTHGLGNFVWIGPQAYERLLQEAPGLASIMEAHSLRMSDGSEDLLFAIKFEELVPRLQRYYELDTFRAKIIDFEPSESSIKLLNVLALQIANAKGESEFFRIIDVISSYRWRGFKEKDQALKLLLSIFESSNSSPEKMALSDSGVKNLLAKLANAISSIGYPSQIINQAYVYKIELRNMTKLQSAALNPNDVRHSEAWVTIASIDHLRLNNADLSSMRTILNHATKRTDILSSPATQARVIDTVAGLIKRQFQDGEKIDASLMINAITTTALLDANYESLSFILDTLIHLTKVIGNPIILPARAFAYFEQVNSRRVEESSPWHQAVVSRWHEYKGICNSATQTKLAAS